MKIEVGKAFKVKQNKRGGFVLVSKKKRKAPPARPLYH